MDDELHGRRGEFRFDWSRLGKGDDVLRRDFLQLGLVLGSIPVRMRAPRAAQVVAEFTAQKQAVDWLDQLVSDLASQWNDGYPDRLQRRLTGIYSIVCELAEAPTPHRTDLGQIAGRIALLRGLLYRFLGYDMLAEHVLVSADRWGDRVGDHQIRAVSKVWLSDIDSTVQAGLAGPSPRHVRQLLDGAERLLDRTMDPAIHSQVLMRQAEEQAAYGATTLAYRYLERADTAWAANRGSTEGLYGIGWTDTMNRAFWSNVVVLAGHPAQALPILRDVIECSIGSNHIAATTDLASALAQLGEAEQSVELLLTALADATASGFADRLRRIRGVYHRDLSPYTAVPAVTRLNEALMEAHT